MTMNQRLNILKEEKGIVEAIFLLMKINYLIEENIINLITMLK